MSELKLAFREEKKLERKLDFPKEKSAPHNDRDARRQSAQEQIGADKQPSSSNIVGSSTQPDFPGLGFTNLPPELRRMIVQEAAQPLLLPRIVEIHEEDLEIRFATAVEPDFIQKRKIKHFRSVTPCSSLLQVNIEFKGLIWEYFEKEDHLGHELCLDKVPFSFERDSAYFTQDTLMSWMRLWRKCSDRHPDYPLNDDAGLILRNKLRRIVFDVKMLLGHDEAFNNVLGEWFSGNADTIEQLGPGLAAFPSLEEIILVVREDDADVHMDCLDFTETSEEVLQFYDYEALHVDEGLGCIKLADPQPASKAAYVLRIAEDFLRTSLEFYFNKFEIRRGGAFHKPSTKPSEPRKIRTLPIIKKMVKKP
ncbi:uncharacterized protein LY89DRAFT_732984 [Mollisia scopiformis]|uniref:2EXR domain-containing protein n=1 Tax=Mollisia scopiformis TaxID=149040 RepID=A0A194XDS5_MOLSC|nr:uncharacterized protein LY89DRAFT_732984 [Mollisia scopiformis]KUJ18304.1 hypothetical protein LY89DRAFT_732984 [Mollisia scopiformis]